MKKYTFIILFVCVFAAAKTQTTTVTNFDWLLGNWAMNADGVHIYENWTKAENNTYNCQGFVIKDQDTIVTELIKIEKIGQHWVYIAQINNNNPVLFTLTPASAPNNVVFENTEHDNPQRIIYKNISSSRLFARTEAMVNGKLEADEYDYTRR
jgi:hypothetical protein